jgi:hypothetical protein
MISTNRRPATYAAAVIVAGLCAASAFAQSANYGAIGSPATVAPQPTSDSTSTGRHPINLDGEKQKILARIAERQQRLSAAQSCVQNASTIEALRACKPPEKTSN